MALDERGEEPNCLAKRLKRKGLWHMRLGTPKLSGARRTRDSAKCTGGRAQPTAGALGNPKGSADGVRLQGAQSKWLSEVVLVIWYWGLDWFYYLTDRSALLG